MNSHEIESLISELKLLNLCSRCMLRFLGIKKYTKYVSKEEVQKAVAEMASPDNMPSLLQPDDCDPAPKRLHATPCSSCLGILQSECDDIVIKIESAVRESEFEFSDFVIQLSVPVAIDLRQSLIQLYLKRKLGSENQIEVPSVKEVWKWVVGFQLGKLMKADFTPYSEFQIAISILYEDLVKECTPLFTSYPEAFPNRRNKKAKPEKIFNRTSVTKAIEELSSKLDSLYKLPPDPPDKNCTYEEIVCTHSPLYLGGRYNKYSRELSQTPWVVDDERMMESSVQELITDVVQKFIRADNIVFSASGREDVDVRMLGKGRPFVLEIFNPRKCTWTSQEIKNIENAVNQSTDLVAIRNLQVISKNDTQHLKDGEEQKRKSYTAKCIVKRIILSEDLEMLRNLTDLVLKQKTPIRVLHRRPLAIRDKVIHKIDGTIVGDHEVELKIETQAGTYIKEFVHGDFGRTVPNLGSLLKSEVDIVYLDVESIHLDWPPNILD